MLPNFFPQELPCSGTIVADIHVMKISKIHATPIVLYDTKKWQHVTPKYYEY